MSGFSQECAEKLASFGERMKDARNINVEQYEDTPERQIGRLKYENQKLRSEVIILSKIAENSVRDKRFWFRAAHFVLWTWQAIILLQYCGWL